MYRALSILAKCWLLLCCVAVSRQLSITEFEVPHVVKIGEDVILKCSYELLADESEAGLIVKWWMTPVPQDAGPDWKPLDSVDKRMPLYQRIVGEPTPSARHNVVIKEHDTILLSNVTPADSGVYECEVALGPEDKKRQELIVFTEGTGPELNVTRVADGPDEDEDDDVSIDCTAVGVAPLPYLIVTVNGGEVNLTLTVSGPDKSGLYEAVGNATLSASEVDGADIRCDLLYVNPNVTHPPYVDSELYYLSGAGTTEATFDTTEDTTTDSLQQSTGHGSQAQASWMLLGVGTIALTSLVLTSSM